MKLTKDQLQTLSKVVASRLYYEAIIRDTPDRKIVIALRDLQRVVNSELFPKKK